MGNVILLDKDLKPFRKIARKFSEKENYLRALEVLFSAKNISCTPEIIADIADVYTDMGLLDLSNKYWYLYLDKVPKEKVSVAYEELAINYFYLDNYLSSSYYFHEKLTIDGFINKENLGPEILDFFSGEEIKKSSYRVVYPFDKADFSFDKKRAKRAISAGAFLEASKILKGIPEECRDEEINGDLAVALYMNDELDEAEKVCRSSILYNGENITAFCNLSTIYDMKEDFSNSEFYYQKALSVRKGEKTEPYKIATCAIERKDHNIANENLGVIVEERPYDVGMRFFYGLSFANLGNYLRAEQELSLAYKINPNDFIVKWFLDYIRLCLENNADTKNLLPFNYVKEIPNSVAKVWKKKIKDTAKNLEKINTLLKNKEFQDIIKWGLYSTEGEVMRDSAFILSTAFTPFCKKVIFEALLDIDGGEELKRLLVYILILKGEKQKFGVVAGSLFFKFKPKRLLCEKGADGDIYLSAYALCVSRIIFNDVGNLDKIANSCDRIYKSLKGRINDSDVTNEEIGALILYSANIKRLSDDRVVMSFFNIDKNKFLLLKEMLEGDKNGKNN